MYNTGIISLFSITIGTRVSHSTPLWSLYVSYASMNFTPVVFAEFTNMDEIFFLLMINSFHCAQNLNGGKDEKFNGKL